MHFSQQQTRNQNKVQLQHLSTRLVLSMKVHKKKSYGNFLLFICFFIRLVHLTILHTNHSFPFFLSACFLPPIPFYPLPHPLLLCLYSEGVRTPMGINKAWHIQWGRTKHENLHENWARHPTISKRIQRASSQGNSQKPTRITPGKTHSNSGEGT